MKKDMHPFTQTMISDVIWKITRNEYESGAKLPSIESIAETFGVARTTVREAIKYMEFTGLVYSIHGKGTFITDFSPSSNGVAFLEHVVELRLMIEGYGIKKAAVNRTEDDIAELEELLVKMDNTTSFPKRFIEIDRLFHSAISKASKNPFISNILQNTIGMFAAVQDNVIDIPNYPFDLISKEHHLMVEAIKNKDLEMAQEVIEQHMATYKNIWLVKKQLSVK